MSTEVGKVSLGVKVDSSGVSKGTKKAADEAKKSLTTSFDEASKRIEAILNDTGRSMKSKAASIGAIYKAQGMSSSEAMRKAWEQIERGGDAASNAGPKLTLFGKKAVSAANSSSTAFSGLNSVLKKTATALVAVVSVKALVGFSKKCIDLGSDLAEVQNVVDVTFTSMNGKINEFAQNAAQKFGLSEIMAKRYTGTFGAMAKAFGFAEKDAAEMSMTLTGLAGDVASFYNIDQDAAYTKLKSVFSGETESLKDLGIVMTQTALDQFALQNGFGQTTAKMSEQQKVALRYQFILSKLSDVSGDFARTSNGWANQVRILKLQFESLCSVIGSVLIAALSPAIRGLNRFMGALVKAANTFKSFVFSLFGKESEDMAAGTGASMAALGDTVEDTMAGAEDATSGASDGLSGVGDAAKDAAKDAKKAAKEMQRSVAGFDIINKLGDASSSSGNSGGSGGGSGSGAGSSGVSAALGDTASALKGTAYDVGSDGGPLDKLTEKLKALFAPFQEAWNREGMATVEAAKYAFASLKTLAVDVGKSVAEVWTNGTGTEILSTQLKIVQNLLNTVGNLATVFDEAWKKNQTGTKIVQDIADIFLSVLKTIEKITAATAEWSKKLDLYPLLEGIETLLSGLKRLTDAVGDGLADLYEDVLLPLGKWTIEDALPAGLDVLSGAFNVLAAALEALAPWGKKIWDDFLAPLAEWAGDAVVATLEALADALNGIADAISAHPQEFSTVVTFLAALAGANAAIGIVTGIAGAVSGIVGGITGFADVVAAFSLGLEAIVAALGGPVALAIAGAVTAGVLLYENWDTVCQWAGKLRDTVVDAFGKIKEWIVDKLEAAGKAVKPFNDAVQSAIDALGNLSLKNVTVTISAIFADTKAALTEKWNNLTGNIKDKTADMKARVATAWNDLKEKWSDITGHINDKVASMKAKVATKWNDLKSTWNTLTANFKNKTADMKAKVATTWGSLKGTWNDLMSHFKDKTAKISLKFSAAASDLKKWINAHVIDRINSAIPKTIKNMGFKVPHLAQGGYVRKNTPQLAMIGDNRHQGEVVAPEGKLLAMAKEAAASAGGSDPRIYSLLLELVTMLKTMPVYRIDEESLRKYFIRQTNRNTKTTGKCELMV